jgi:D-lactate dehydrogenase
VIDNSSCAQGLAACIEMEGVGDRVRRLNLTDAPPFVLNELAPHLTLRRLDRSVALHPPCSAVKLDQVAAMRQLASACATKVTVPDSLGCCGFAGDRGMLHPELTESATRAEAAEIVAGRHQGHYSSNVTCEIGLTKATGRPFHSLLELVEEASR